VADLEHKKEDRVVELERRVAGLRKRVEKLGGESVRSEYKILHLTQEVRRSREAFGFLAGFQNDIGMAGSIGSLYDIALKSIVAELWMKRAIVLERNGLEGTYRPVAALGYHGEERPVELSLPEETSAIWSEPALVNGETDPSEWIENVRTNLSLPFFTWIPNITDNGVETVLVAGSLAEDSAQEPRLTDHDLALLTSVGAILWVGRMNLVARQSLKLQVRYESLLHRISEVLLKDYDSPRSHFDSVITRVGRAWSLDRVRIVERLSSERMTNVTHEWTTGGTESAGVDCSHPVEGVPEWRDCLALGEQIRVDDINLFPKNRVSGLSEQGVRSLLVLPITVHKNVVGWMSFEQCSRVRIWTDEETRILDVIAGLMARAMARETELEERAHLEAEYYHSKKMEAVGQLAGGVAHDFNNLLTTIQGYAQLLTIRLPEEYREQGGLKEIIMASERAAGLTRQLLTFSRKDKAETSALDINETIEEMMELLKRMLGDVIKIRLDLDGEMGLTVGDKHQISQMVMNLAVNAKDAMPEGGEIHITTREFTDIGPLAQRFTVPGVERCHLIEVTDTGTGMSDEIKERIFEPFFTTKEAGKGTGLGLSIVFSVVRRHGGFVELESKLGKGTTFRVFLPVKEPEQQESAKETGLEMARGNETVLVVEDDESIRSLIIDVLKTSGYDVLSATNGREALEEMKQSGNDISLVMTDVVMPEMNGRELWDAFANAGYNLPVVVMSGYPKGEENGGFLDEAAGYLQKPFGPREVTEAVRRALDSTAGTVHGESRQSPLH
jgi:signal transduction histidine kinase/ActR/RegA family two-component response regulator